MILLDGDAIVYKVGFACETTTVVDWRGTTYRRQEPKAGCARFVELAVDRAIENIKRICDDKDVTVFLTDGDIRNNNRYKLCNTYKQSRGTVVKPLWYSNIRNYLVARYGAVVVTGIEADDALGEAQTEDSVIVSHDKDLFQIPGKHYSLTYKKFLNVSDPGKLHLYRDKAGKARLLGFGFQWFCAQMLLGDDADNIQGLNRYGPVKVHKLLADTKNAKEAWEIVLKHYKETKQEDRLEVNKILLWMARPGFPSPDDYLKRYCN